jgi:hypothetical protein
MVEPVFSQLRGRQGLQRFRRNGLSAVRVEFALHAMAYLQLGPGGGFGRFYKPIWPFMASINGLLQSFNGFFVPVTPRLDHLSIQF